MAAPTRSSRIRGGACACAAALGALAALAACGGGGEAPAHARARSPCPAAVRAALGAGAQARLVLREPSRVACLYRVDTSANGTSDAVVRVTLDSAPQASFTFKRGVVERGQEYVHGPSGQQPHLLQGVGDGASWVPTPRELMVLDADRRIVTVTVVRPRPSEPPRATAVAVARAVVG